MDQVLNERVRNLSDVSMDQGYRFVMDNSSAGADLPGFI